RARKCTAEGYTVPLFRDGASMIGETAVKLKHIEAERDSLQTSLRLAAAQKAEALLQLNETAHNLDRMTEDRNKVLMSLAGVEHKLEQSEASLKLASDDLRLVSRAADDRFQEIALRKATHENLLTEAFDMRRKMQKK